MKRSPFINKIFLFSYRYWPVFIFLLIYVFIFRKVFFSHLVLFPGDLLTSWFFPYNSGGWVGYSPWITHKEFILADVVRQIYPWRILAIDLFQHGMLPLWNPYSFSGNPLVGNLQSAFFYPFNFLFFIFEERLAWTAYIMLQPILATWFMYLFIRSLKLSRLAAIFSGITFAFMGYMMVWFEMGIIDHAALWLPFILWGITKFKDTKKIFFLVLSAIGITCSLFSGHAQTSAYVLIFILAYFLFIGTDKMTKREIVSGLLILFLGITLSGIQLIPSYELMTLSVRTVAGSIDTFQHFIIPISHLALIFAPDFFGNPATNNFWGTNYGDTSYFGVVALIVGAIGFYIYRKNKLVIFCLIVSVISLLIAFVPFVANLLLYSHIPVINTGVPSRTVFLFETSFAIVAAFGVEAIQKEKTKKIFIPIIIILIIYLVLWGVSFLPQIGYTKASITHHNLLLPTAIALVVSVLLLTKQYSNRFHILWVIIFCCMAIEYSYFLNKYLPMGPMNYMFPQQELITELQKIVNNDRVYGYDTARISRNLNVQWKVQTIGGYDPLYIKSYAELINAGATGELGTELPRSDAYLAASLPQEDSSRKQALMSILGVKYVLDKDDNAPKQWDPRPDRFPPNRFKLIYQQGKWKIYQNKKALPRALVFYNYSVISQKKSTIKTLFDSKFPYTQKVILTTSPSFAAQATPPTTAKITNYSANDIEIVTDTKRTGLLFLSDNYYPGWQASIDGKSTSIFQADYSFRGVEVPSGKHTMHFAYRPMSFYLGAIISLISAVLLVIVAKRK